MQAFLVRNGPEGQVREACLASSMPGQSACRLYSLCFDLHQFIYFRALVLIALSVSDHSDIPLLHESLSQIGSIRKFDGRHFFSFEVVALRLVIVYDDIDVLANCFFAQEFGCFRSQTC